MSIHERIDPVRQESRIHDWQGSDAAKHRPAARVLVVDDEPHILDFLSTMLEDEGFEVLRAENAFKGFELAKLRQPDLVISDVMMPGATGIDLYTWLQQIEPTPRVVFMSAVSRRSPAPHVPLLEKPFDIDEMLQLVDTVITHAS